MGTQFKNKLNDLTGKEWIKFTKSWEILNEKNDEDFLRSAVEKIILFFSKENSYIMSINGSKFLPLISRIVTKTKRNLIVVDEAPQFIDYSKAVLFIDIFLPKYKVKEINNNNSDEWIKIINNHITKYDVALRELPLKSYFVLLVADLPLDRNHETMIPTVAYFLKRIRMHLINSNLNYSLKDEKIFLSENNEIEIQPLFMIVFRKE